MPALAAAFLKQLNPGKGHAPVHGFAHVVDGEQGNGASREGFHLHAGLAQGLNLGLATHARRVVVGAEVHRDARDGQGVAQGNELAGAFGGLNASNAGHAQHVALFGRPVANELQRGGLHVDLAMHAGHALGVRLVAHIDHVGLALCIEMGERHDGAFLMNR
jgi:hypothetical protein